MPLDARPVPPGTLRPSLSRQALVPCLAAAWLLGAAPGALAQQTVIIGGGPAPTPPIGSSTSGGAMTLGGGGSGIVVNDSVLDSLGPGAPASGVPMAAPQAPVYQAQPMAPGTTPGAMTGTTPGAAPGTAPGTAMPGGAYRLPGSGELVVTRPATLLYPPMQEPESHLALPRPDRATAAAKPAPSAQAGKLPSADKLTSRLIAAPPKQSAAAPAAEMSAMPEATAPKAMAKTEPQATAKPSVPPPPSLAKQIQAAPAAPAASPAVPPAVPPAAEPPAIAASIAPTPMPAPQVAAPQVAAPQAPPPPPQVAAPQVTAPSAPAPAPPPPAPTTTAAVQQPAVQEASRTAGVSDRPAGGEMRLTFGEGSAELTDAARQELLALARDLSRDTSSRIQLLAYAAEDGEGASKARRLSLSRALAVRAFLIDQGVRSTRMDVRALGSKVEDGPPDRVDVKPQ